jgi:hypothetical protein
MIQPPIRIHPRIQLRFRILFPILILFLIPLPSFSNAARHRPKPPKLEDPTLTLKAIHKKFKKYDSQREDFEKVTLATGSQPAAEGSKAYAFKGKSGKILIVDESYFAEMGQSTWSYYFDGRKPFFIVVTETKYAFPITVNTADRKKLGGGEDKTTETRYYFKGGKLIRWLEGKKAVPVRSERFHEQAKSVLELATSAYSNAGKTAH